MKKIIIILLIAVQQFGIAQNCEEVLELNIVDGKNDYSNLIDRGMGQTIDQWDWTVVNYSDIYLGDSGNPVGPTSIRSPFFHQGANGNIDHLQVADPNTGVVMRDFHPEDGWEVVYKAFGVNELNKGVSVPTFALYNRYTGVLRSFFYVKGITGYSSASIEVAFLKDFSDNESSLLEYVNTPLHAVDDFQRQLVVHSTNSYSNSAYSSGSWLYSEIPLSYDPCSCGYVYDMTLRPYLNKVTDIKLVMNGGGTIIEENPGSPGTFGGIVPTINKFSGPLEKGVVVAKKLNTFVTFAEKVGSVFDLQDGTMSTSYKSLSKAKKKKYDSKYRGQFKLPGWLKDIPNIGIFFGVAESLIGGGRQIAPPRPASSIINLDFTIEGEAAENHPYDGQQLKLPGTVWAHNPDIGYNRQEPLYNNLLGVFSLLKTPLLLKQDKAFLAPATYNNIETFQISGDFGYAVNPASGLIQKPVDIKASLVFEGCQTNIDFDMSSFVTKLTNLDDGSDLYKTPYMPLSCFSDYTMHLGIRPEEFDITAPVCSDYYIDIVAIFAHDPDAPRYSADSENVIISGRYKVSSESVDLIFPLDNNWDEIPLSISLGDIVLDADKVIRAWSNIDIQGVVETNGFKLTVIAGNEITGNLSDLPNGVDLIIGSPADCPGEVLPQTTAEINTLCADFYDPMIAQPRNPQNVDDSQSLESKSYLKIHPNPFQDYFKVTYRLDDGKEIMGFLRNALGQTVKEIRLEGGANEKELIVDSGNLPIGIYFLTIQTESDLKTVKLMKQAE